MGLSCSRLAGSEAAGEQRGVRVLSIEECSTALGAGSYGVVRKCVVTLGENDVVTSRHVWAQKTFQAGRGLLPGVQEDALRELVPLCEVPPHPCVLRAHGVVRRGNFIALFTPLYSSNLGELFDATYNPSKGPPVSERVLAAVAVQLLHGLRHLHAHGYLHRDIKLENVFVASSGAVVLGDLGLCKKINTEPAAAAGAPAPVWGRPRPQTADVGTPITRAPEMYLRNMLDEREGGDVNSGAADVWAAGVTLLAALRGDYAIDGDDANDFLREVWKVVGRPPARDWPLLQRAVAAEKAAADAALARAQANLAAAAAKAGSVAHPSLENAVKEAEAAAAAAFANDGEGLEEPAGHYGDAAAVAQQLRVAAQRPTLSDVACDFLQRVLETVPERRLSADAALAHPFVAGIGLPDAIARLQAEFKRVGLPDPSAPDTSALRQPIRVAPADTLWLSEWPIETPPVAPASTFKLARNQPDLDDRMRSTFLGWLWETTVECGAHKATFVEAVAIVDRYRAVAPGGALLGWRAAQLLGVAALSIAVKLGDTGATSRLLRVSTAAPAGAFSPEQIAAMEFSILKATVGHATPEKPANAPGPSRLEVERTPPAAAAAPPSPSNRFALRVAGVASSGVRLASAVRALKGSAAASAAGKARGPHLRRGTKLQHGELESCARGLRNNASAMAVVEEPGVAEIDDVNDAAPLALAAPSVGAKRRRDVYKSDLGRS